MKKYSTIYSLALLVLAFFGCNKPSEFPNMDPGIKGCGDFIVNKIIGDDMIVSVKINHSKIAFSKDFQVFENVAAEDFATVKIEQNCDLNSLWYYTCNDVYGGLACPTTVWKLEKGKLAFKVSKVLQSYHCNEVYLATVVLYNAAFKQDGGAESLFFEKIEFNNVTVGLCAG